MQVGPESLLELRRAGTTRPDWFVDLVQPEISGGNLEPQHLAALDEAPNATALRVSGLSQATFEQLVTGYGDRFVAIEFWKCPRIADLSPLEDLSGLQMASFYWNQRTTRLWDLTRTPHLVALRCDDFTRLHVLDDLRAGTALRELMLGDAVWLTSTYETLEPLASLSGLEDLSLHPKRIDDGRIQPLGSLPSLKKLTFPTNLFTTEQIAWLKARLPEGVESNALAPLLPLNKPLDLGGKTRDVLLIGKRKPILNSEMDAARINKHVQSFDRMLNAFRADPAREPERTA